MKLFIANLRRVRIDQGISYRDIELDIEIAQSRMKEIEEGVQHITIGEMDKLLAYYNLSYARVMKYKRYRFKWVSIGFLSVLLLFTGLYYGLLSPWLERQELPAVEEAAVNEAVSLPDEGAVHDELVHSSDPVENDIVASEAPVSDEPAEDPIELEKVVLRFWGNLPYSHSVIPEIRTPELALNRVIEVFTIEQLTQTKPDWLQSKNQNEVWLNAASAGIWTAATREAYLQLKEEQYNIFGLGTTPEIYEPQIIEIGSRKIGLLSLASLIHDASEVATNHRIGLPKAYSEKVARKAVEEAKQQVDYLYVLMHWGKRSDKQAIASQKSMAQALVEAGADFIIGNRPIHSQEFELIQGIPVIYALGHSVSKDTEENSYNFVLETEFTTDAIHSQLLVGKMVAGEITFQLNVEDKDNIEAMYSDYSVVIGETAEIVIQ